MNDKNNQFPVYRKLEGSIRIYKITSEREFEEKQRMGSKTITYKTKATQYPDLLRIQDMLNFEGFELSNEKEWSEF